MNFPPSPGDLGKRIFESVSKEAWQGWVRLQTMIINENRLNLADPQHRKYLMEQAEKYFFGEGVGGLLYQFHRGARPLRRSAGQPAGRCDADAVQQDCPIEPEPVGEGHC